MTLRPPLAERMRPRTLDQVVGQDHLVASNQPLRVMVEQQKLHSMVFWGPPGSGKTTLAKILSTSTKADFIGISAVTDGIKEIRAAVERGRYNLDQQISTIVFVDEVHRFNKAQQDAFLPHIENGTIIFMGATTENPAFELNRALTSRLKIYILKAIEQNHIVDLINAALKDSETGLGDIAVEINHDSIEMIAALSGGDARRALNVLESSVDLGIQKSGVVEVNPMVIKKASGQIMAQFDKGGDEFYEQISALHKAVRGSDPDGALYWGMRMLDGGCDPLYLARRILRIASEDVGNADPRALSICMDAWQAYERLGSPEGELAIIQALLYLASVPKSNAVYNAYNQARADMQTYGREPVPLHLRNAPTKLQKQLDYGTEYRYSHNEENAYSAGQRYFPETMPERQYYQPTDRGMEKKLKQWLEFLQKGQRSSSASSKTQTPSSDND